MSQPRSHSTLTAGLRLALSMFTIIPITVRRVDRQVAGVAMAMAPAVGAAMGTIIAVGGVGLLRAGASRPLAAVILVAAGAAMTRGLHLDGLADTADGLGCYRDRQTALDIMKKSDIGPFGVIALVLALIIQVIAITDILERPPMAVIASLAAATATGRVAVTLSCRRGIPAARDSGLGALVAGTVAIPTVLVAVVGIALLSYPATPTRQWQGPLAAAIALILASAFVRHTTRRLGGITGDVLGAAVEITYSLILIGLAFDAH